MDLITDKFNSIENDSVDLPDVYRRPFFDTMSEAREYCMRFPHPADGMVAISMVSTDMKNNKDVKSMELELGENDILSSKEGTLMASCRGEVPRRRKYNRGKVSHSGQ